MAAISKKKKVKGGAVRPTILQEKLADGLIANAKSSKPQTRAQIARQCGYSSASIENNPAKLFSAQGLQVALAERGITSDKISDAFNEGMEAKQGSWFQGEYYQDKAPDLAERRQWLSLLGDFLGMKKQVIEQKSVNVTLDSDQVNEILG